MITTRLGYKVPKWHLTFLEFSQVGPGWIHFHNGVALSRSRGLSRLGQDVPRRQLRKGMFSLLGSLFKRLVATLQGRSSNIPPPWDSLYYAGDQSSPNAVLLAKLKSFVGLGLLMVALAPLPVRAEGRDDGEHSLFVETFETLKDGYCYEDHIPSYGAWEWVTKFKCGSKGGVLLAKADCQKSYKKGRRTFCGRFKTNDRFKEARAEFKRKEISRKARARKDNILRAKKILAALGYYQSTEHVKDAAFSDRLSRAISDFLESTSTDLADFGIHTDAIGRRYLSTALMEKLSEADQGYCFSPPYGKPQAIAAQREGWCLKESRERFARLSSAADCTADQGFLLPRDACRTDFGSTCKILRFDAAAAFLRGTEGEKEIHFASNATQCIDQGGLLISEKDCAEKRATTTLLRQGYCRRIPAERFSAIKARWLAATAYCYLGESRYINKTRSACKDAGGIVLAPMYCAAFSSATAGSRCLSLNPAGNRYVKTVLASRDGAGDAQATNVAKADKQPEEKNTGEADQALTAAEEKKRQQEVVDVDPLVGVWDTGSGSEPRRFLAFKINDVGKYEGITWQRATPEGLEGYWSGGGDCRHTSTSKPDYYRLVSFKVSRNTIENVQIKEVSRITATLGDGRISIKGRWSYQQHSDRAYFSGSTTLNKDGRLKLSGNINSWRACTFELSRGKQQILVDDSVKKLEVYQKTAAEFLIATKNKGSDLSPIFASSGPFTLVATDSLNVKSQSGETLVYSRLPGGLLHLTLPPDYRAEYKEAFTASAELAKAADNTESTIAATPEESPLTADEVIALQKALAFFGLYKGSIDGDAGPNTQRAVNQWLKKQGRSLEEISRALIQEITTEAKVEKIRIANAEEEKQQAQKAKAEEVAKQKEREERNQLLIALRSELLENIVSARDLLANYPGYPQKADLEKTINEAIAILVLDDLEAMTAGKAALLAAIENLANYRDQQIALADDKKKEEAERQLAAAIEAEAKRKAEEEKQKAEKARLAEEQSEKASDSLAGLSLEPMDKVFQVPETTNIRAAPKVLSDRVGRINAGESLTILAKVSGEHWYLVETDQGKRGFVFANAITPASGEKKATAKAKNPAIPDIDFGKYHALVIGNNAYRELPKLQSAINDARAVGALLETQYGFEVELLTNATRSDIYGSLASMRRTVGSNENLLIYYAGHGWLDKEADEGYWMPIDAEEDNPSNWLSSANLISEIRRSKAKHILVVADSCFSGTLTRGLTIKTRTPDYLERIVDKKARTALTSGGLEPVMDSGGESNHSVFASAFLGVLKDNDAVLDGHQLFTLVRKKVIMGSEQTPGYGDIRRSGHDGGDFLFVRR